MLTTPTQISTDLNVADMSEVFARFRSRVGERHWRERIALIKAEIRGNAFLRERLHQEYEIAFGLEDAGELVRKYGQIPVNVMDCRHVYPAIALAAQVLSLVDTLPPREAEQLIRRVYGALKNPDDMRALQLELAAATHFTRRGCQVTWPETNGGGTMDLLIADLGPTGLEVECKSMSEDKGRRITRRETLEFWHLLSPRLKPLADRINVGLAVVITLPGRLPHDFSTRKQLVQDIASGLFQGKPLVALPGATVQISEFDPVLLDPMDTSSTRQEALRPVLDTLTNTENREFMIVGRKSAGALAVVLQSAEDDVFLSSVFRTLSDSAGRQFSKTRASLFLVGFHGIDAVSLLSVVEQDYDPNEPPTSLTRHVSKFLSSDNRAHVVGVGFMSRSGLLPHDATITDSGGSAYIFSKKESPFWHDDFAGLFSLS